MRKYLSIFRMSLVNSMQHRFAMLSALAMRFAWGLMEVLAYAAIYGAAGASLPMDFSQTVSYVWVQQALFFLFSVVYADGEICSKISYGSIAYELVRPINLYGRWFSQAAASRVAATLLYGLPVLLIALILPAPYNMALRMDAGQMALMVLSTVLALGVVVAFAMLMYVSLFYTLSQRGVKIIVTALTTFFSGGVIPLPFFPAQVLAVVRLLPFAAMQNMPLMIFAGKISGTQAINGVAFQAIWLAVLVCMGELGMKHALKKVVVQGG